MLLKCSKCNEMKDGSCFHIDKRSKTGYYYICKDCRNKGHIKSSNAKKLDFYIKQSIIRSIKKNRSGYIWERVLGFTLLDLKKHLEYTFDSSMNWDNYGKVWGIALIIPKSYYKYNGINDEFRKCWSLKNLIALPIEKCHKRKIDPDLINKYQLLDVMPSGVILLDKKIL